MFAKWIGIHDDMEVRERRSVPAILEIEDAAFPQGQFQFQRNPSQSAPVLFPKCRDFLPVLEKLAANGTVTSTQFVAGIITSIRLVKKV